MDVAALGLLGIACAQTAWLRATAGIFLLAAALVWPVSLALAASFGVPDKATRSFLSACLLVCSLGMSLAAWAPTAFLISLAAASLGHSVGPLTGMGIFSSSTLLGAAALLPAGVGVTGSMAIVQIQDLGISLASSVLIVSLVRLSTVGMALLISVVFLLIELRTRYGTAAISSPAHFDKIAAEYQAQWSAHVWSHLLNRRATMITGALRESGERAGVGLDLGCGLGMQRRALLSRGYRVVGLDAAHGLLKHARSLDEDVICGDGLALPFRDGSFDFVYTIGVLHHIPGETAQQNVMEEVARVLKPGGMFLIQETNPRNPLFRFYMGYVFPVLKSIDEGVEVWIDPRCLSAQRGFDVAEVRYFTFIPDFLPRWLRGPFHALERKLESSVLRSYSVHYMATLRKRTPAAPAASSE